MRKAILVLGLLAAGWSAAWFALAFLAGRQVDGFIVAEMREGREWTCPDRHVSGYPVSLVLTCRDPTYAGQASGQRVEAQAAGLDAALAVTHPLQLRFTLVSPFTYKTSDGRTALSATWRHLAVDLGSLPTPRTLSLRAADLVVQGRAPGSDAAEWRAAALDADATASPPQQPSPTLDLSVAVRGMPLPALDDVLGGMAPINGAMTGRLTQASAGDARTPEQALEQWRRNGGNLALSSLDVSRAGAAVHADGTLGLDEEHRPKGKLDASFKGLGPILSRYGINGDVAALGSLIGTFFGTSRPTRAAPPGSLNLPIVLGGGRVGIGPITTAVKLAPLY